MKDPLFEQTNIGCMAVKNRIYMPAMHLNMAQNFEVTDQLVHFYAERAKGGAGAISVGYATIDDLSGSSMNIGAHKDEFIPGLKRLAEAIQSNGSCAIVQLNHSGRYNHSFFLNGKQPVAPSAIASRLTRETPRMLELDEIQQIIDHFAQAALRVKKAGYNAVEVLAGTGYLISEFLSPLTNQRTDQYGGSLDNRMRFGVEIMLAIKQATGSEFPLIVRINGNEFMPGGSSSDDLQQFAMALEKAGVDALCINVGWHEARVPQIVTEVPRGVYGYLAKNIKEKVKIPVIASHRINDPNTAREMLADGICDLVAIGRGLIADPFFPEKAKTHKENEIVHCVACAQGCFDHLFQLKSVACLCNPKAGYEKQTQIEKVQTPKRVMVIGGGAAGMSAAISASEVGHDVTLYEQSNKLGGQLYLAAAPPGRDEFAVLARDLEQQLIKQSVKIVFNQMVSKSLIEKEKPDAVIIATGAKPIKPNIPGADLPHVIQAWDVLSESVFTGKNIVIIGGGAVGVETALFLSDKGTLSGEAVKFLLVNQAETPETIFQLATKGTKEIVLIEMLDAVGKDIGKSTRWAMMQDVNRRNISIKTASKALEIKNSCVMIETKDGATEEIKADTVVLAIGSCSYNPLQSEIESLGIPVIVAGDALKIGKAFEAIHQGFACGRQKTLG